MPRPLWSKGAALSATRFTSGEGSARLPDLTTYASQISDPVCTRGVVAIVLRLTMTSGLSAADITGSEGSFGCIRN